MPAPHRPRPPAVIERLLAQPQGFEFFQAVRLLQRWLDADGRGGREPDSGARRLRFRNSLSMGFPAGEIESLALRRQGAPAGTDAPVTDPAAVECVTLTPSFIGLLGSQGALPHHYTEQIARRELYDRDPSARAFLDLFTHRAVALLQSAWEKHRLHLQHDSGGAQRFLPLVLALAGLGQGPLRARMEADAGGVADESVAYFAGAVHGRGRSAAQVQRLLSGYLGVPVRIDSFVGRWYALPPQATSALGLRGTLGQDAVMGERVWQRNLAVRVVLGPLDRRCYLRFLPGGAGERALRRWFVLLTGVSLDVEVRLQLRREAVRGITLDATGGETGRLGWDTFLRTEPETRDREDVCYGLLLTPAEPAAAGVEEDVATEELTPWP